MPLGKYVLVPAALLALVAGALLGELADKRYFRVSSGEI